MKIPVNGTRGRANNANRIDELEHELAAERKRSKVLQAGLEKSRRWARAWKCAAKSNLQLIKAVRNLRQRTEVAGIGEANSSSNAEVEILNSQLDEAQQQIEFLERECQRWTENAAFYQERVDELSLIVEELQPAKRPGRKLNRTNYQK